jgi:CHAD domain-containing protein
MSDLNVSPGSRLVNCSSQGHADWTRRAFAQELPCSLRSTGAALDPIAATNGFVEDLMASVTTLSRAPSERRGLAYWMERVVKELQHVRKAPETDAVHDLRVAIRRCRSVGAVMQEVDPDPAWRQMRTVPKKLFRRLGELRDAQVMDEWVRKLAPTNDSIRTQLHAAFAAQEPELRARSLRAAERFEERTWERLERKLRKRARFVAPGGLAAECLAVERFEEARELHTRALRTDKSRAWHELRIGLKRLRYTVENLLPELYEAWSENLKRLQDLLGEVHDLDVLAEMVKENVPPEMIDSHNAWEEIIRHERGQRIETYRQLTLGKTSIWNDWRQGLPQGKRLTVAAMARLRATARATDPRPQGTAEISRIAMASFDALKRTHAAPVFGERPMRRILRAAIRLQRADRTYQTKSRRKAALRFFSELPMPPSWTFEEWELLAWTVRYRRGAEPSTDGGAFARLSEEQQRHVRALAGILRLARTLRKSGIDSGAGIRAEKSPEAVILHVPGLEDSAETAARLAAGKHLLETYLGKPLILKPAPKPDNVVALLAQFQEHQVRAAASD